MGTAIKHPVSYQIKPSVVIFDIRTLAGAEVRCAGRLFQRLAAETGKARLPTIVKL